MKHSRSKPTLRESFLVADTAHEGQVRKYTGDPYIVHPLAVAKIVQSVTQDIDMLCAAMLHDTVEDTTMTNSAIQKIFGVRTANFVNELTDICVPEDGNRALRKSIERRRLNQVSAQAQTIKLADLIDNSKSILDADAKFASTYMSEMEELLGVLTRGSHTLHWEATMILKGYRDAKPTA
tara:strand:- start:79882 stop:80421 length:540 start_codon:yes stop_codon:yes gene_type:complete